MDYNISVRQTQLENFQQFIESSKSQLNTIFSTLGWDQDALQKDDHLETCIYDKSHRVAPRNLEEHIANCSMKHLGYSNEEVQLSEPSDNKSSIILDHETKTDLFAKARLQHKSFKSGWSGEEVEPKTSDRLLSMYTSNERLALYNFVIFATKGPKAPPEFTLTQPLESEKELTREERLELERNAKRRRIKYKSVHLNRKNHTEVMREVIGNQMELYEEYLTQKTDGFAQKPCHTENANGAQDETRSTVSKHSAHSSTSSHCKSSKRMLRGNSVDFRDKNRESDRHSYGRNGDRARSQFRDRKSDYHQEDKRHSSREWHISFRTSERSHREKSRGRSESKSSKDRLQNRESSRESKVRETEGKQRAKDKSEQHDEDKYCDKYDASASKSREARNHHKKRENNHYDSHDWKKDNVLHHSQKKRRQLDEYFEEDSIVKHSAFT